MNAALLLAGLAMGAAATPHCLVMCGGPSAAIAGGCARRAAGFQAGRWIGYAAGGAAAAGSVALLGQWSEAAPVLRPLWTLLHLAFLALGLWWLVTGRQPPGLQRDGAVPIRFVGHRAAPLRAGLSGLAWVAWPCPALQSALLVAALADGPAGGALVMTGFALASMPALTLAPWAWSRWQMRLQARGGAVASPAQVAALGRRVAGLALAAASGSALTHGLWQRVADWCLR